MTGCLFVSIRVLRSLVGGLGPMDSGPMDGFGLRRIGSGGVGPTHVNVFGPAQHLRGNMLMF